MGQGRRTGVVTLTAITWASTLLLLESLGRDCPAENQQLEWPGPVSGAWIVCADGNHATKYHLDITADVEIHDDISFVGLYLRDTRVHQRANALEKYYASHISCDTDWELLRYMIASAHGLRPFAYLNGKSDAVSICDGARYFVGHEAVPMSIPGDFPCGTYILSSFYGKVAFILTVRGEHCAE